MTVETATERPVERPRPLIDDDHQPFWDALARREFLVFKCRECGAAYWPVSYCRNHVNEPLMGSLEWVPGSGRGQVFTFNIHRRAFHPAFEAEVPYVIGVVELDEGPMFFTRIVGCNPDDVRIGMRVRVRYEQVAEDVLPYFEPEVQVNSGADAGNDR
jgi:uncharacterized OB-fold protein